MGDVKLFKINGKEAYELHGQSMTIEKSLQTIIENNSEQLLGLTFLASEYSTGQKHAGRIDSLAIDENFSPVILEYKRATNENVINQGLFYLDWLMDHKAEFEMLVMKILDTKAANKIDWETPRLLCIAGGFTKYDIHAVQQINRNIELYRYKKFDESLFMLDLINVSSTYKEKVTVNKKTSSNNNISVVSENINRASKKITDTYNEMYNYIMALGDDVQVKELKYYMAFKKIKNFACIELLANQSKLLLYVKVDMDKVKPEKGFIRDVTNIGHYGTGNLCITIKNIDNIEKAKPYILESYTNN